MELLAQYTKLGNVTALAREAGIKEGAASKHKSRNSIPGGPALLYQETARKFGVDASYEWITTGRGPAPQRPSPNFRPPAAISKLSTGAAVSDVIAPRVPLWQFSDISRGSGASVHQIVKSDDSVIAPIALENFKSAFAVRVWDASNGPYLPRGTILFVERTAGGASGDLCLFASSATETEVLKPILGILESEPHDDGVWRIIQHTRSIVLKKSEYPLCWRIKHTRRD